MSDDTSIVAKSREQVAYDLMKTILHIRGSEYRSTDAILQLYRECLLTVMYPEEKAQP